MNLIALATVLASHVIPVKTASSLYVHAQIPPDYASQQFFAAWDCWIQHAGTLRLAGAESDPRAVLELSADGRCSIDGISTLRFRRLSAPTSATRFGFYELTDPAFATTPLAKEPSSQLHLSVRFAEPIRDTIRSTVVLPVVDVHASILYYRDGRPVSRGFAVSLDSPEVWSIVADRFLRNDVRQGPCDPPIHPRVQCPYDVEIRERVWRNSLTGEQQTTTYEAGA